MNIHEALTQQTNPAPQSQATRALQHHHDDSPTAEHTHRQCDGATKTLPCPSTPLVGVVAVIRDDRNRFLTIRRAMNIRAPGAWCFPGGAIEPGETQQQALIREVREEIGLSIEPIERDWTWHRPDGLLILHWWRAVATTIVISPNPAEVADYAWKTRQQIRTTPGFLESNLAYLNALASPEPRNHEHRH